MRIVFITAGAAGMYCGSCMRDNTLVSALRRLGHDAILVPTYTPIRTDEPDASQKQVFFGGINVYLQQKSWFFRHTPWLLDRLLNFRWLLRWVSRFAVRTKYSELGEITFSMLRGTEGNQRKEVTKLTDWLAEDVKPEIVLLTNALLSGIVPELKRALPSVPVLITLQGDDIFLDALPEQDRNRCIDQIRRNDASVDGYISTSRFYADYMAGYLGIARHKLQIVYPGINLTGFRGARTARSEPPFVVGYFARICPEKGFHNLVDGFIEFRKATNSSNVKLRASGWLGENNRLFFEEQVAKLRAAGLANDFEYVDSPGHTEKVRFLESIDVLAVPTTYREPKGLYVLEAWASGVPVVLPEHGVFPELIAASGGGLLVPPDDTAALAQGLRKILEDHAFREQTGRHGEAAVRSRFTAEAMAQETLAALERFVGSRSDGTLAKPGHHSVS